MTDVELIRAFRKSPIYWVERQFGLVPQPLKKLVSPDLPPDQYRVEHFEPFIPGQHITWQQWTGLRCVELAIDGKAPRLISIRSGHGTGKSSLCALLLLWFLFCFKDAQVPCTAPTADQLKDVLWKEVRLWIGRMKPGVAALYEWQDQYVRMAERPATWFARARTGRKENPEALAGVHAPHIFMFADEASGIAEEIYETAQGALTNKNIFVLLTSNPTRLSGYFFETHNKNKRNWQTLRFNSEDSPIVDPGYCTNMAEQYGIDSPQYAIRVKGEFPLSEEDQFILTDLFDQAASRVFTRDLTQTRALGVDVATFGDDATALTDRQGNVAELKKLRRGQDTMATVGDIVHELDNAKEEQNPFDFLLIDVIGIGRGVYDRCKELQKQGEIDESVQIIAVNVSEKPYQDTKYVNRTAELWDACKTWLAHASVDPAFKDDLCQRKYSFDSRGRLQLEKKEDMKERGLPSPDQADSLVLTFAVKGGTREKVLERRQAALRAQLRQTRSPGSRNGTGAWWTR